MRRHAGVRHSRWFLGEFALWQAESAAGRMVGVTHGLEMHRVRVGGVPKTNYPPGAKIGDPVTIVLHIVNHAPNLFITQQSAPDNAGLPQVAKELRTACSTSSNSIRWTTGAPKS